MQKARLHRAIAVKSKTSHRGYQIGCLTFAQQTIKKV